MNNCIRVNADYESQLFYGRPGPAILNQSIEFLSLFLEELPLLSTKNYSAEYLDYVESFISRRPRIVQTGRALNWWGELRNLDLERKLNSKVTSTQFSIDRGWDDGEKIIRHESEIHRLNLDSSVILKNPFGMSGQKFQVINRDNFSSADFSCLPLIAEPYLERVNDFSTYVFPDKSFISYENLVDERFQYKGTVFNNYSAATLESLSFYGKVSQEEWQSFEKALKETIENYGPTDLGPGFSIDSFVYKKNSKHKIRHLCEVNWRRTMGRVAYDLSVKFGGHRQWSAMILTKPHKDPGGFSSIRRKLSDLTLSTNADSGLIILSPGDTRFDIFFLSAVNNEQGKELMKELQVLLPQGQFPIEF